MTETKHTSQMAQVLQQAEYIEYAVRNGTLALSLPVSADRDEHLASLKENCNSVDYYIIHTDV